MNTKKTNKNKKKEVKYPISRNLKGLNNASLFSKPKKGRRRTNVNYEMNVGDNDLIKVRMDKQLDVADQDLMLAIFAIGRSKEWSVRSVGEKLIESSAQTIAEDMKMTMGDFMFGKIPSKELRVIEIVINKRELLEEMGRAKSGAAYKWLTEALKRLASTHFDYQGEKVKAAFSMISFMEDIESQQLHITINPMTSYAIRRDEKGYVLQHRGERIALVSEEAKMLHSVLSSLVDPAKKTNLSVSKLTSKVYGENAEYWSEASIEDLAERYGDDVSLVTLRKLIQDEIDKGDATIRHKEGDKGKYEILPEIVSQKTHQNRVSKITKALVGEIAKLDMWDITVSGRGSKAKVFVHRHKKRESKPVPIN